jgi:hypothetical protein
MSWSDAHGTFAIVGAQKCGTTALGTFLAAHPDVCMASPAETHFFDRSRYFTDGEPPYGEFHRAVFGHYRGEPAVGWSTPSIMFATQTVERLAAYNPALRVIVLLRHPAERAYSHYRMQVRAGLESLTFQQALEQEPARVAAGTDFGQPGLLYSYASRGFYGPQIRRLLRHFERGQVLFIDAERLLSAHKQTLSSVYGFLGVGDPPQFPEPRRVHAGPEGSMSDGERVSLVRVYAATVSEVEGLVGWDLAGWRE